jgi:succinoglycan biosynthesis transport protein ExoP
MTATHQPYLAVSRRPLDLEDYINVARRHSGWIAGPTFAGFVISVVVALVWPNLYEAKAVMEITPSRISANLVQSVVSQRLSDRVQQMRDNIESRASLANIINDPVLGLYKEEKAKEPMEDVEDKMRSNIKISFNPETVNRDGGSTFAISFQYRTKIGARQTVDKLISRFEAESVNSQHDVQTTATDYFGDQLAQARLGLEKQNQLLTKFRTDNEGRLPEQQAMNIAQLQLLENQASGITQDLNRLSNERLALETQITYLDNQMKLSQSFAQDVADAPAPNSTAARENDELAAINKTIGQEELGLQELKKNFRPGYPEVVAVESHLKVLQGQRDRLQAEQAKQRSDEAAKPKSAAKKTTNYALLEGQSKIDGELGRVRALLQINQNEADHHTQDRERLNKEIETYRTRLAQTFALEAPYQDLQREQKTAADKYEKYEKDKDLTSQSADLITRGATEFLEVLDSPTTPHDPASPHRYIIVGAGFAISLMLGLALAGVQEARDSSLKNLKDVRAYTNLPVLCSIPLLENTLLVKRKRRVTYLAWSAAVIVGILAVCGASFYYFSAIANT